MPAPTPESRAQLETGVDAAFTDPLLSQNTAAKTRAILKRVIASSQNRADDGLPVGTPGTTPFAGLTGLPFDNPALAFQLRRGTNALPVPLKVVSNLAERAALDPLTLCLESECIVVNLPDTDPNKRTVIKYTTNGPGTIYVHRNGNFDGNLSDAQWYPLKSPEAAAPEWASLQAAPPVASYNFPVNYLLRHPIAGNQLFFATKVAGVLPAPSLADGDANYLRVARETVAAPGVSGAPQWVAGAQTASALVYDLGLVYRVKTNIANSTSAPAGNSANYELVGPRLLAAPGQSTTEGMTQKAIADALTTFAQVVNGATNALRGVYSTFAAADAAFVAGDTMYLHGSFAGVVFSKSGTYTGSALITGTLAVSEIAFQTGPAIKVLVNGLTASGRVVVVRGNSAEGHAVRLTNLRMGPDAFFEHYGVGSTGAGVDRIVVENCSATNGAAHIAAGAGAGLLRLQQRPDQPCRWTFVDSLIASELSDLFSGYGATDTRLVLSGSTATAFGATRALLNIYNIVTGVYYTPAQYLIDHRSDTFAVLTPTTGSIALDFNTATVQTLAATGNVVLTTANRAALKNKQVTIANTTGAAITVSGEAWVYFGPAPITSLPAGKKLKLTIQCLGAAIADVEAANVLSA